MSKCNYRQVSFLLYPCIILTTYCTKNEHNSSIPFLIMACGRKCVMDTYMDGYLD